MHRAPVQFPALGMVSYSIFLAFVGGRWRQPDLKSKVILGSLRSVWTTETLSQERHRVRLRAVVRMEEKAEMAAGPRWRPCTFILIFPCLTEEEAPPRKRATPEPNQGFGFVGFVTKNKCRNIGRPLPRKL